jgi:hypothetical protein
MPMRERTVKRKIALRILKYCGLSESTNRAVHQQHGACITTSVHLRLASRLAYLEVLAERYHVDLSVFEFAPVLPA